MCCAFVGRSVCVAFVVSILFCFGDPRHNFGVRSGILFPWWSHTLQTQSCNAPVLIMAAKDLDYNSWSLEDLRAEASERSISFVSKDGIKTLASKLRVHDKLMANPGDESTED